MVPYLKSRQAGQPRMSPPEVRVRDCLVFVPMGAGLGILRAVGHRGVVSHVTAPEGMPGGALAPGRAQSGQKGQDQCRDGEQPVGGDY